MPWKERNYFLFSNAKMYGRENLPTANWYTIIPETWKGPHNLKTGEKIIHRKVNMDNQSGTSTSYENFEAAVLKILN